MKTSSRLNLPLWLLTVGLATILPAAMLMLSAQASMAGSATWLAYGGLWSNADQWTLGGPPNGPSDVATFGYARNTGNCFISAPVEVDSIVFAMPTFIQYGITLMPGGQLNISGAGIINNGQYPGFSTWTGHSGDIGGTISFWNNATAGDQTGFGVGPGALVFNNASSAG